MQALQLAALYVLGFVVAGWTLAEPLGVFDAYASALLSALR